MTRAGARALPIAGVLVLAVLTVIAWSGMLQGFALAGAIGVALGLGYAAGLLRGTKPLRRIAEDVERLAAGAAPRPWDEPLSSDESRVAEALAHAGEELSRRGREGELARDRALFAGFLAGPGVLHVAVGVCWVEFAFARSLSWAGIRSFARAASAGRRVRARQEQGLAKGPQSLSLIWLYLCQAGSKNLFRFFHGSSSDLAQWTVELAPAA